MFNLKNWFIKEHAGLLKFSDTYDILDPASSEQVGIAKERPGQWIIALRFLVNKKMLPTRVDIHPGKDIEAPPVFSIKRGFTLLRSRVEVVAGDGRLLGSFQSKVFSLGGAFRVFDGQDQEVALVKGDWKGWNFKFLEGGTREVGKVTKKWAGMGKELFTSADNYMISIEESQGPDRAALLLAAGLAIDTIYKE